MIAGVEPVTSVRVSLRSARRDAQILAGAVVFLAFAAGFGYAAAATASSTGRVAGAVVGAVVCAALAAALVASWWVTRGIRALVVDPTGITLDAARRPWSIQWSELSRASVRVGYHWGLRSRVTFRRPKRWRVHLELVLADTTYAGRHPEMAHLRRPFVGGGPDRFGLPLAQRRELVAPMDEALRAFGGARYGPVVDDGELRHPGYQPN
ncbi:hypothetical protein [uncultured Jatrophihabitans sp.]|uniref:hypothetical protein n=1 Tax=uncultured Jatrophihabitans sp. TaxID=1610747 RepID=UPI0035CC1E74